MNKYRIPVSIIGVFMSIMGVTVGMLAGNNTVLIASLVAVCLSWAIIPQQKGK